MSCSSIRHDSIMLSWWRELRGPCDAERPKSKQDTAKRSLRRNTKKAFSALRAGSVPYIFHIADGTSELYSCFNDGDRHYVARTVNTKLTHVIETNWTIIIKQWLCRAVRGGNHSSNQMTIDSINRST